MPDPITKAATEQTLPHRSMKNLVGLEKAAMWALSIYLFTRLHFAGWYYPALLLLPDISILAYAAGNRIGAFGYNLFHHKGVAIVLYIAGLMLQNEVLQLVGIILFGHASMDRLFGYGLKYVTGFHDTHLGKIGKAARQQA